MGRQALLPGLLGRHVGDSSDRGTRASQSVSAHERFRSGAGVNQLSL